MAVPPRGPPFLRLGQEGLWSAELEWLMKSYTMTSPGNFMLPGALKISICEDEDLFQEMCHHFGRVCEGVLYDILWLCCGVRGRQHHAPTPAVLRRRSSRPSLSKGPTTAHQTRTKKAKKESRKRSVPKFFRRADRSSASGRAPFLQPTNP